MYMLLEEVESSSGQFEIPRWIAKKKFFKILIEGEKNALNVWKVN
jgi:hypothetical protein